MVITARYYYYYYCCFYEAKLCLRKLILLLFFSQRTPLHESAIKGHLEVARLLLQCNADMGTVDAPPSGGSWGEPALVGPADASNSLT